MAVDDITACRREWELNYFIEENHVPLYTRDAIYEIKQIDGVLVQEPVDRKDLVGYYIVNPNGIEKGIQDKVLEKYKQRKQLDDMISDIRTHAPKLIKWLNSLFCVDHKFKKSLVDFLIVFMVLVYQRNFKSNDEEMFLSKIFVLSGTGGTGKSSLMRLIGKLTPEYLQQSLELAHLGRNFETSCIPGKTLLTFNDEALSDFNSDLTTNSKRQMSALNRLSGADSIRLERKFGGQETFKTNALILISTNTIFSGVSINFYTAVKRRYVILPFTVFKKDAKENFIEGLAGSELDVLKTHAMLNLNLTSQVLEYIRKFDLERLILKNSYRK